MATKLQKKSLFDELKEEEQKLNENLETDDYEEDYLDVDRPVPQQNYVCLSFISPEKVLNVKEDYYYYFHNQEVKTMVNDYVKKETDAILEKAVNGKVDVSVITDLRNNIAKKFTTEVTFNDFKEKLEDFKYLHSDEVEKLYHEENNFHTTVRGVKVRGVFNTYEAAQTRSKVLQRMDKNFNIFIGQVGYWLPWDPNADKIADQEYLDKDLNKIVKCYNENKEKKDAFFEDEKERTKKEAAEKRRLARAKREEELREQKATEEAELNEAKENAEEGQETKEEVVEEENPLEKVMDELESDNFESVAGKLTDELPKSSLEEEKRVLDAVDPWMQRKMREEEDRLLDERDKNLKN